jgi:hypothetical protein
MEKADDVDANGAAGTDAGASGTTMTAGASVGVHYFAPMDADMMGTIDAVLAEGASGGIIRGDLVEYSAVWLPQGFWYAVRVTRRDGKVEHHAIEGIPLIGILNPVAVDLHYTIELINLRSTKTKPAATEEGVQ